MKILALSILLLSFAVGTVSAGIIQELGKDIKYLGTAPEFYAVVGGIALAPELFSDAFDRESPELARMWGSSEFVDNFFDLGTAGGHPALHYTASLAVYALGSLNHSEKLTAFGSDLIRAHLINGLLTGGIKSLIDRTRPNGESYSYPSGHSSISFTTASVLLRHYGLRAGLPAYLGATYVALSRLEKNKHYISDVLAGAILGTYISLKITHRTTDEPSLTVQPYLNSNFRGLTLTLRI